MTISTMTITRCTCVLLLALLGSLLAACGADPDAHDDLRDEADIALAEEPVDASQAAFIESHRFRLDGATHRASNAATGMELTLDASGIEVARGGSPVTRLELTGWGRTGAQRSPAFATPQPGACAVESADVDCLAQLEFARGELLEWWRNGATGFEQGFELATSPAGSGALRFTLDVDDLARRRGAPPP